MPTTTRKRELEINLIAFNKHKLIIMKIILEESAAKSLQLIFGQNKNEIAQACDCCNACRR